MEQLIERCCGLDVHKATVIACVRVPGPTGRRAAHVQSFGTTAPDLLALRDWLVAQEITQVAMESTGVYWKPVPIRELRDLTPYRKSLIQDRTRVANRLHKVLEDAGIKLGAVTNSTAGSRRVRNGDDHGEKKTSAGHVDQRGRRSI